MCVKMHVNDNIWTVTHKESALQRTVFVEIDKARS